MCGGLRWVGLGWIGLDWVGGGCARASRSECVRVVVQQSGGGGREGGREGNEEITHDLHVFVCVGAWVRSCCVVFVDAWVARVCVHVWFVCVSTDGHRISHTHTTRTQAMSEEMEAFLRSCRKRRDRMHAREQAHTPKHARLISAFAAILTHTANALASSL